MKGTELASIDSLHILSKLSWNLMSASRRRLFGTSGIRGIVNQDLSSDFLCQVAKAIATNLPLDATVCLATDTRQSRELVKNAVISGFLSSGVDVVDLGILPTPALALLTREMGFATGIMITASHNPPEFNGIKLFNGDSSGYSQAQEAEIERIYFGEKFTGGQTGNLKRLYDAKQRYLSFINGRFPALGSNHLKVVVDSGNGAASRFASDIFVQLGLNVIPLNDEPDGLFPGRSPEPKEDTMLGTVEFLRRQNADLAVCFDGDADRVVFCDREGFLGFNEPIAFISRVMIRETGKKRIATTVETGRLLDLAIRDLGGKVVRGRVGDVNVAHLARELDAALGVEQVGVYIIPKIGYYPDSILATLILLSHIKDAGEIRQFFQHIHKPFFKKSKIPCPDGLKSLVMTQLQERAYLLGANEVNKLDGLRLEFDDSWMLIRASGTEPVIRVIAESASESQADDLIKKGTVLVQDLMEVSR